jgi:hypothetical protein
MNLAVACTSSPRAWLGWVSRGDDIYGALTAARLGKPAKIWEAKMQIDYAKVNSQCDESQYYKHAERSKRTDLIHVVPYVEDILGAW